MKKRTSKPKQKKSPQTGADHWKKILTDERTKLADQLHAVERDLLKRSQREAAGDLSGYGMHMADVGTDSFEREVSLKHAGSDQKIVFEIDEALKRIDEGIYGICQRCKKKIKKDRLKIVPYARFCISCQSKEEKHPRADGGS